MLYTLVVLFPVTVISYSSVIGVIVNVPGTTTIVMTSKFGDSALKSDSLIVIVYVPTLTPFAVALASSCSIPIKVMVESYSDTV